MDVLIDWVAVPLHLVRQTHWGMGEDWEPTKYQLTFHRPEVEDADDVGIIYTRSTETVTIPDPAHGTPFDTLVNEAVEALCERYDDYTPGAITVFAVTFQFDHNLGGHLWSTKV